MPTGQQQGLATDLARELAEGDERAGESDGTDEDADVDLHFMDRLLGGRRKHGGGVDVTGKAHQAGGQAHQAVHQRDELGHLRHLDLLRRKEADAAADDKGTGDPGNTGRRDTGTEHGGQHGNGHADHAEQVAAPCGLWVRESPQAEDEQDGGGDVGNGG